MKLEDQIWELLHTYNKSDWHDRYKSMMSQLPIEKQRIWQVFRNYSDVLFDMQILVVKAEACAMKVIASNVNEEFCVWPNYPFAESYKIIDDVHYLPPIESDEREWPYPVWDENGLDGNCWCKTLFVPGTAKSSELHAIFDNTDCFDIGWSNLSRDRFNEMAIKTSEILNYLPWVGMASFIYEPVYYIHICSNKNTKFFDKITDVLKLHDIPFGCLASTEHGTYWHEKGCLGLGSW